ncbi:hypothetical protein [Streptomyces marianii]|uniref:Uncharacterized protein n=1 Tax=Streptomyces marianii TaxID=1817406 RepID=A0A5R9DVX6_9ACTN|nr:hypothetical protein [Streptomyces marianii]TLQ39283.1 hypothetical protein FEF34_38470 [Streptomyces marianii]
MTVPTFLAPAGAPAPTRLQRAWLLAALRDQGGLLPPGIRTRSLNVMLDRDWIKIAPAGVDGATDVRYKITPGGRFALLSAAKAGVLLSVLVSSEPGRIEAAAQEKTLGSLIRDGLVTRLARHGEHAEGQEQHLYITNLGRRLVGLPEVDETPASDYLVAAFAANGLDVSVETDSDGDTCVVYQQGDVEAAFFREIQTPGFGWNYSARHPAWMHTKPWAALVSHTGGVLEKRLPSGIGIKEESARMAASFAAWLTDRDDSAFTA